MSDSSLSVPPVSGPPLMHQVAPVSPVRAKPVPPPSTSTDEPTKSAPSHGLGGLLDILV
jgi:hypothetical protein